MAPASTVRRNRQSKCCNCLGKLLIFLFYMVMITGFVYFGLAFYLYYMKGQLFPLIHNEMYRYAIYLVIAAGTLNIMTIFFSCAYFKSKCASFFYFVTFILAVSTELVLLYCVFSYSTVFTRELKASLHADVLNYGNDTLLSRSIDHIQAEGKCCGSNFFNDYPKPPEEEPNYYTGYRPKKVAYVPDSCCKSYKRNCAVSDSPNNIYYIGCLDYLKEEVKYNLEFIFVGTAAALILKSVVLILACCTCGKNKPQERSPTISKNRDQELYLFDEF